MKILIIEDDELMGAGLQAALNNAGFNAHWVTDGGVALELLSQVFFALRCSASPCRVLTGWPYSSNCAPAAARCRF